MKQFCEVVAKLPIPAAQMLETITVLYVDDEENNLVSFRAAFRRHFNVLTAISGAEALPLLRQHDIHVIVTDQRMPGMTGVEFLQHVIRQNPEPIRILLTGFTDIQAVIDAINKGEVYRYLNKPWDADFMRSTIYQAYEVLKLRRDNKVLIDQLRLANEQLEFYLRQKLLS